MSEYKAPKRSYLELLEIFKKEIVEKPGETEDEKRTKYFAVITLQEDLKANFDYYYEYELLKLVLQDYKDVLNKKQQNKYTCFYSNRNNCYGFRQDCL